MLLKNLVPQCGDKRPSMLASTHITFNAVRMDRHRSLHLQRGGMQSSMPDAPEESLLQNPLQKEVIIALPICAEECRHYTRSNLQLLHILHSLFQGQSSVPMSIAMEEFICIRASDLVCSVTRLGDDMATSHKRLDEMMQTFLHKADPKQGIAGDDMQAQASFVKFVETSKLTSTTAEVQIVPPKPALPPLLNVVSVVDVPCPSALFVCSDIIKDVAADAT